VSLAVLAARECKAPTSGVGSGQYYVGVTAVSAWCVASEPSAMMSRYTQLLPPRDTTCCHPRRLRRRAGVPGTGLAARSAALAEVDEAREERHSPGVPALATGMVVYLSSCATARCQPG
jgi:hypothetical protein